jgi:mannitol-1-phosphate/altronate dehydrogenase
LPRKTQEALSPQDGLYTLSALGGRSEDLRVIGSLRTLFAAPSDIEPLLATTCDPKVRIVSLTVTEKGYCHDPATCELVGSQQDIALISRGRGSLLVRSAAARRERSNNGRRRRPVRTREVKAPQRLAFDTCVSRCLAGYETVSDAMANPGLVRSLMDTEVTPTLVAHGLKDVTDCKLQLLGRFKNPALCLRTSQIAMDGPQKLPQRLLGTVRERLVAGAR